jgi:hypothetical protein
VEYPSPLSTRFNTKCANSNFLYWHILWFASEREAFRGAFGAILASKGLSVTNAQCFLSMLIAASQAVRFLTHGSKALSANVLLRNAEPLQGLSVALRFC